VCSLSPWERELRALPDDAKKTIFDKSVPFEIIMSEKTLIRVGHSPDPDDAFMFHALANDKIDTGNYRFTHELQDIESLNHRAQRGELELTAVSIHGFAYITDKYALCACGASIGDQYGPMEWLGSPDRSPRCTERRSQFPAH
jgi:hypothetical protein